MWTFVWCVTALFARHDGLEPTDRLIPTNWQGNPWGPEATRARAKGEIPPIQMTASMRQWEKWGKKVLHDGDILFRRGDAKLLFGRFPFSRFLARVSGSEYSHTGIVSIENGEPVVYDTTKAGVRRQPFYVWILDNAGPFGVKRPRPEFGSHATLAVRFCQSVYERQAPFDYDLGLDDKAFYCVEMSEKAYRNTGMPLSEPIRLGDMENINRFPIAVFVFLNISKLTLDQHVYFPGNERHGIWSSRKLMTVYPPAANTVKPAPEKPTTGESKTAARNGSKPT
jgi:hypothetical protein